MGRVVVVGISYPGVSCLPAPAPRLPLAPATVLGGYGHRFPFEDGGFSGFPHPSLRIRETRGERVCRCRDSPRPVPLQAGSPPSSR